MDVCRTRQRVHCFGGHVFGWQEPPRRQTPLCREDTPRGRPTAQTQAPLRRGDGQSKMATPDDAVAAQEKTVEELGLPSWLEDMLKPGVSSGIFMTLKLSLVFLVLTLVGLLCVMTDQTIRMHVSIFLFMSIVLLGLVIWFIGELAAETAKKQEADVDGTEQKKKK